MEDSTTCIHASRGKHRPASEHLLSEPRIVAEIAKATLEPNPNVPWDAWVADYALVRDEIEASFPDDFRDFNRRLDLPGGFPRPVAARAGMVAHMGVIAVAAPLIALGLPERWRPGPSMPTALPVLASLLELIAVWGWHAPVMRAAAETSVAATVAEQATFLTVGVLLWSTSFAAPGQRTHAASGAAALLLTSIHMTLLGALLALSPRPLYGAGEVTCFGVVLGAAQDQQMGGVIMLLVGAVVYLAGGLSLVSRLLGASAPNVTGAEKAR